ncbi:MAG: V-type ATP synthase subunit E [Actinomycetota bacterium]
MALDDMLKALEEDGKQQQSDIMETARIQARDIIKAAESQAGDIKSAHVDKMNKVIREETTKLLAEAKTSVDREVNRTKDDVIEDLFDKAHERLRAVRASKDYPEIFRELAEEALSQADGTLVIHVDPRDKKLAEEVLAKSKADYTLETDLTSQGGVEITAEHGRITISNTLESRADRARRFLKSEVAASVFG